MVRCTPASGWFGDMSGHDFWRDKAAIKHLRFVERPAVRDGRLVFVTESQLQALDGIVIGVQVSRFALEARPGAYFLTWEAAFTCGDRELVFGDQEEMGLGVRGDRHDREERWHDPQEHRRDRCQGHVGQRTPLVRLLGHD